MTPTAPQPPRAEHVIHIVTDTDRDWAYPHRAVCQCGWTSRSYAATHAAQGMADYHRDVDHGSHTAPDTSDTTPTADCLATSPHGFLCTRPDRHGGRFHVAKIGSEPGSPQERWPITATTEDPQ